MIILGIDTAMRCTGYGLIHADGDNFKALDCGVIKNSRKITHSECLRRLAGGIKEIIRGHKIDAAAIEGAFYGKNIKTTLILGYARGCVMTVLAEAGITTYAYSPKEVKLGTAGSGFASKQQVAVMMSALLDINIDQLENDATDALGLALCHANRALRTGSDLFLSKPI